jgi:outer membrane lipoprotein-sorting protein
MISFLLACALTAPATEPAALLARVQKTYHHKSVRADFCQTYTDAVVGPRPAERGTLQAAGDGRVRFDYVTPTAKHFVFDGNTAYFFEPEAAQVTVMEQFADSPAARTMAMLWGEGAPQSIFQSAWCSQKCPPTAAHERALILTPLAPMAGVERIDLVVDVQRFEVVQTVLTDPLGNQTRYQLSHRVLGQPMNGKAFAFAVPEGVSVLRTRL